MTLANRLAKLLFTCVTKLRSNFNVSIYFLIVITILDYEFTVD